MRTSEANVDLTTAVGSVNLPNPVMTASGTAGYGSELCEYMNLEDLGAIVVKLGEQVKRGQLIAEGGYRLETECGAGMEHLDFSISNLGPPTCKSCEYLGQRVNVIWKDDLLSMQNPHEFWSGGRGKPECFIPGKAYKKNRLTLPVECKN